jgi:hypothetical protein
LSRAEPAVVDDDDEFEFSVAFRPPADAILVASRPPTDTIPCVTVLSSVTAAAAGEQIDVRGPDEAWRRFSG